MLTIIASMDYELSGLRQKLQPVAPAGKEVGRELGGHGKGPDMLVIGVGKERAQASVRRLLENRPSGDDGPSHKLLLLGVAGAVDPELRTGDLALASRYFNGSQSMEKRGHNVADDVKNDPLTPDPLMWELATKACAGEARKPFLVDSLTVGQVIGAPEEKRWIAGAYPVGIVEMEDYWVAEVAAEFGVAFLSARVVLDTADQALPGWLLGLSRSKIKAVLSLAARPWRIPTVVRLARQRPVAQRSLTRFALNFLAVAPGFPGNDLTSITAGQNSQEVSV